MLILISPKRQTNVITFVRPFGLDFNVKYAEEAYTDSHLGDEISYVKVPDLEHECTTEAEDTCTTETHNIDFRV